MNIPGALIAILVLAATAFARLLLGFSGENIAAQEQKGDKASPTAVAAENLLRNPGIEEGEKSPAEWTSGAEIDGVEYLWDKERGQKGKASLCLNKTANRYFPIAQWYQIIEATGGNQALQVSAQVKAERA